MNTVRSERRWVALVLVMLFLMAVARSLPAPGEGTSGPGMHAPPGAVLDVAGGRQPRDHKVCALSIGLLVGGIAGIGLNPMMGAACISWGFHVALVTCI